MSTNETFWLTILGNLQLVFILIGMVIFLTIPKQGRKDFAELGLMILVPLITETAAVIGYHIFDTAMNLAANIYLLLNLPLIILLYRRKIHWKNRNAIAYTLIVLFISFALINLFFIQGPQKYNSFTSALSAVCIIIISLTYFYVLIQQLPTQSISSLPMFWINSAMLIYRSGTFFIYLTADYLVTVVKNNLIASWFVHQFLGLIFYSMLWYGMLLIRAQYLRSRYSESG